MSGASCLYCTTIDQHANLDLDETADGGSNSARSGTRPSRSSLGIVARASIIEGSSYHLRNLVRDLLGDGGQTIIRSQIARSELGDTFLALPGLLRSPTFPLPTVRPGHAYFVLVG